MQEYLDIEELHIPVILQVSSRKTLAITVTREGQLLVKAPFSMKEREIERFLRQKRYWIYKQTKRILEQGESVQRSDAEIHILREKARKVLTGRTDYYKQLLDVEYRRLRIGDQKTRWGSCSSKGTISYNWRLVLMPEKIMDYVVVHELCHLLEMNHSAKFWKRVSEVLPDYKDRRKWLKENGEKYQ